MAAPFREGIGQSEVAERMLRRIAVKVELPPSQHKLACERKKAIEAHLERPDSPLRDLIGLFYQQGSMAIGATIRAKHREDGYDIDIVVEMNLGFSLQPNDMLNLLFAAVRGEKGARYYDITERQTRCVTVQYADGMHLDLTPSELIMPQNPRKSFIFHAKEEEPRHQDQRIPMNAWGFAEEFNTRNPVDTIFADSYAELAKSHDRGRILAETDSEDVPAHSSEVGAKSVTVVALQLLKRFRTLRYRQRTGDRMPPSVMLSCFALEIAKPGCSLCEALYRLSNHARRRLKSADDIGELIDVRNPRDVDDCFTDRWPAYRQAQILFIEDLGYLIAQLTILFTANLSLAERGEILQDLFGETVGREVVDEVTAELAQGAPGVGTKRLITGASVGAALTAPRIAAARPASVPGHTFYGGGWPLW